MSVEITTTRLEDAAKWAKQSLVERASNWGRKFSLFSYPFVTACCGMEFMSVAGPKYDLARFGAEFPRFSPRQSDLLMVVGTITEKQGPALKRVFDQMAEPKWVIAFGVCASTGGFYQNYHAMPGTVSFFGFAEMLLFVAILVVALAYVWRKKAIGWE